MNVEGLDLSFEQLFSRRKQLADEYTNVSRLASITPMAQTLAEQPVVAPVIETKSPLDQIREDWKKEPHTPEFVTRIDRAVLELVKPHIEIPFTMPDAFPGTQLALSEGERCGDVFAFQPIELATPEGRYHLAQGFKAIGNLYVPIHSSVQKVNKVTIHTLHAGWRRISGQIDAPHLGFSANRGTDELVKNGNEGIDENEYLRLGLHMKATKDVYPDQNGTWTWLLNSSQSDEVVGSGFHQNGYFYVVSVLLSDNHNPNLGVRLSSGVSES